jgi:hypothetical protein
MKLPRWRDSASIMEYRIVYDVLNDGLGWGAPTVLSVTLFFCAFGLSMARRQARGVGLPGQPAARRPVSRLVIRAFGLAGLVFAWLQCQMFRQQEKSKEWALAGQYSVVEGTVFDYFRRQSTLRFQVAATSFSCGRNDARYRGALTARGAPQDALRNRVRVRIAHQTSTCCASKSLQNQALHLTAAAGSFQGSKSHRPL